MNNTFTNQCCNYNTATVRTICSIILVWRALVQCHFTNFHQRICQQDVAVKIFQQFSISAESDATELTSNYASMRYELNRLSLVNHPYVVKLMGVITNPHSFVLEWAPRVSFELERKRHLRLAAYMCPTSLALAMLQVRDGLM